VEVSADVVGEVEHLGETVALVYVCTPGEGQHERDCGACSTPPDVAVAIARGVPDDVVIGQNPGRRGTDVAECGHAGVDRPIPRGMAEREDVLFDDAQSTSVDIDRMASRRSRLPLHVGGRTRD
jgi:hypothetical protein